MGFSVGVAVAGHSGSTSRFQNETPRLIGCNEWQTVMQGSEVRAER
jgi:hypothetical protein